MTINKLVMTIYHVNVLMMLIGMMIMLSVGTIVLKRLVKEVVIKMVKTLVLDVKKWVTTISHTLTTVSKV